MILAFLLLAAVAALAVTGGTTSVTANSFASGAGDITTTTPTASAGTVSGGATPYSYLWQYVSGTAATVTSGTSAGTTFSRTIYVISGGFETAEGIYRCRITDSLGAVVYGPNCTVTTNHTSLG